VIAGPAAERNRASSIEASGSSVKTMTRENAAVVYVASEARLRWSSLT